MIEERGEVVSLEDEYAWVETQRKSSCGSCSANKGCGTGALSKMYGEKFSRVRVLNSIDARPGESVIIGLEEEALVRGSMMMYGLPLVTLLLGALLGQAVAGEFVLNDGDGLVALFGLFGLVAGFYIVYLFSRRVAHDTRYQPVILRHCDKNSEESLITIE